MAKNKFLLFAFSFFYFFILSGGARAANADIIINEIQLSPTEERFIELYNPTGAEINLTNYYIQRKTQSGSDFSSLVSKTYFENKSISAYGYFLISRENLNNADIILSSLTLTESNTIQIKKSANEIIDIISWDKIPEKQSIQRMPDNSRVIAGATPKALNFAAQNSAPNTTSQSSETAQNTDSSVENTISNTPNSNLQTLTSIQADASDNIVALMGQEITFDASKSQGAPSYEWNFGDGSTLKEKIAKHKYSFPGKYIVALTVSDGQSESRDQVTASIYPGGVYISEFLPSPAGSDDNEWIEIYNSNDFPVDLSDWKLDDEENKTKPFIIPQNTFIAAKNYLVFSRSATKISLNGDKDSVRFYYPEGIIIDEIKYEKSKEDYSAARKQDGSFVWTKNATPGAPNIFLPESTAYQNDNKKDNAVSVGLNSKKSANLITSASKYVIVNAGNFSIKNFISTANAQTVAQEEPAQNSQNDNNPKTALENKNNSGNISANISESIKDKNSKNMISRIILTLFTLAIFAMMWQVMKRK